ncbi:hypothetical protein B4098_1901 [Heyndrickxia coagulans]|uniref:Uncharacterized protein n=1 Tax=Heyndrickxia coagulans TaxID=1398 RepID=A0A150K4A0_HEYCO|nr:hypothetical protein B4098_1901 [Heyndrickxia coagulans]
MAKIACDNFFNCRFFGSRINGILLRFIRETGVSGLIYSKSDS